MNSEKIKFGKMLKLIVASELSRSRNWNFTYLAAIPILVFLLGFFDFLTRDSRLSRYVAASSFLVLFIMSHLILKKYANKWAIEYRRELKKHEKKITSHFWIYFAVYWGIASLILLTFSKYE